MEDLQVHWPLVQPIVDDIHLQDLYSLHRFRYLTDRELDATFIRRVSDDGSEGLSLAMMEGLSHAVPVMPMVDLARLAKLRATEGEAFRVYRNSLSKLLSELGRSKSKTSSEISDAFNDAIRPALDQINLTISNSRRLLSQELLQDLMLGVGFVSVGLSGGFLENDMGKIIAGIGGIGYAKEVASKLRKLLSTPPDVRENPYFYLWKLEQTAETLRNRLIRTVFQPQSG